MGPINDSEDKNTNSNLQDDGLSTPSANPSPTMSTDSDMPSAPVEDTMTPSLPSEPTMDSAPLDSAPVVGSDTLSGNMTPGEITPADSAVNTPTDFSNVSSTTPSEPLQPVAPTPIDNPMMPQNPPMPQPTAVHPKSNRLIIITEVILLMLVGVLVFVFVSTKK